MRCIKWWIISLFSVTMMLFSISAQAEFYQHDIYIFNQYKGLSTSSKYYSPNFWDKSLMEKYGVSVCAYKDGEETSTPNISGRGCNLLRYAHAYQILSGETLTTDDARVALLYKLLTCSIKSTTSPNSGVRCSTSYCPPASESKYRAYVMEQTDAQNDTSLKTNNEVHPSEQAVVDFFSTKGGILFLRIKTYSGGGHFLLATGYRYDSQNKLWIHLLDSSSGSTIKAYTNNGKKANVCIPCDETLSPLPIGAPATNYEDGDNRYNRQGNHYWIKWSDLSARNGFEVREALYSDVTIAKVKEQQFTYLDDTLRIAVSIKDSSASDTCRLQSMPYDATEYYTGKVEKGGIIYIKGAVKNSYGNTWYVTEDNLYVYKGDVEITEADASFSVKSAADFVGVVKTKDGYLKKKPFEAADHLDGGIVTKGKTVTIVGKVTNSHNNVWYVTDEGYYIYSGDVTTYVSEDLFPINATFKNTEKRASHVVPYLDSDEKNTIKKDANVTVTKFVTNSHGNIWAQLEDGSYLCFYDKETGENKLKFVSVSQKTTVSGFPTSSSDKGYPGYPTGDRDPKTSCALRGTIKSVAPMLSIEARVTNFNTNKEILSVTAKPKYDLRSAKINSDITNRDGSKMNINNKMSFSKVADDGYYVYEIAVQHGFVYEGKTFSFGDETVVFDSTFTVGNPEEPLPDVPDTPGGTQIGTTTKLLGDVNDDGKVTLVDIMKTAKYVYDDNTIYINLANADMNGDGKINLVDIMKIARIVYPAPSVV